MELEQCVKKPYLLCSLPKEESTCYNADFHCMGDLNPENENVLELDSRVEGYAFMGIEDYIHHMNESVHKIHRTNGNENLSSYFWKGNKLKPNDIAVQDKFQEKVDAIPHHHARGSQYSSSKCPIAVLYANLDQKKVEAISGRKIISPRSTVAGHLRHIFVAYPDVEHEKKEYGGFEIPRKDYTEKRVAFSFSIDDLVQELDNLFDFMKGEPLETELWDLSNFYYERRNYGQFFEKMDIDWRDSGLEVYTIKGTADAILKIENTDLLALIDWKRSRYYKNAFGLQMTAYSLAVEQLSPFDYSSYILISAVNRFNNKPFMRTPPSSHITQIMKNDILIKTLKLKTVFLHSVQRALVDDPELFLEMRAHQREIEETKYGDCSTCEVLYTGTACINQQNDMCDMVDDFVDQGGNLRDLMIDGFQLAA